MDGWMDSSLKCQKRRKKDEFKLSFRANILIAEYYIQTKSSDKVHMHQMDQTARCVKRYEQLNAGFSAMNSPTLDLVLWTAKGWI